jgi:hypothetical protein
MNSGFQGLYFLVPVTGVEPVRYRYHGILSPARLPIPSHRQRKNVLKHIELYIKGAWFSSVILEKGA